MTGTLSGTDSVGGAEGFHRAATPAPAMIRAVAPAANFPRRRPRNCAKAAKQASTPAAQAASGTLNPAKYRGRLIPRAKQRNGTRRGSAAVRTQESASAAPEFSMSVESKGELIGRRVLQPFKNYKCFMGPVVCVLPAI